MLNEYTKYFYVLLLFLCANTIDAENDTTFQKLKFEIHSDFMLGHTFFINQAHVENRLYNYGIGVYFGYALNSSQSVKLGLYSRESVYNYKIIRRNVTSANGTNEDILGYSEDTRTDNLALCLMYSLATSYRSTLDFELMGLRTLNETRDRVGLGIPRNTDIIYTGIDYSTAKHSFAFKARYRYGILRNIHAGFNLMLSGEQIAMPKILHDSRWNVFSGVSLSFSM